jgi:prefoldin subunit 5
MTATFIAKTSDSPEVRSAAALEFIAARLAYLEESSKKSTTALEKIAKALEKK